MKNKGAWITKPPTTRGPRVKYYLNSMAYFKRLHTLYEHIVTINNPTVRNFFVLPYGFHHNPSSQPRCALLSMDKHINMEMRI